MVQSVLSAFFVSGMVFGSFGGVLLSRVPLRGALWGRSHCPECGHVLGVFELVPLVSFLFLWGKCRWCHRGISWMYPFLEVVSGSLFVLAWIINTPSIFQGVLLALTLWLLLLIAWSDAQTKLVPDVFTLPFLFLAFVFGTVFGHFAIWGPLLGGGFFALQWIVSRGKWVGSADILVGGGVGALLGRWESVLTALILAYIVGGFFAAFLLLSRHKKWGERIAFLPFLAIGTLGALALPLFVLF